MVCAGPRLRAKLLGSAVMAGVTTLAAVWAWQQLGRPWVRTSQYVEVRDGTKLAVDIYRPAAWGAPDDTPRPVLWTMARYHRATLVNGQLSGPVQRGGRLGRFIAAGYVVVAADVRGSGASFGTRHGPFSQIEGRDAFDITEWLATQPWCDGKVGMFGFSYAGIVQYLAAAQAPPHLRAICPEMAMFDLYSFLYPGGVFRAGFTQTWSDQVERLDKTTRPIAVDEDADGTLLDAALRARQTSPSPFDVLSVLPFRDSVDPLVGEQIYASRSPSTGLEGVRHSGVAVFHLAGWFDLWTRDALLWFTNLDNPRRLVIGPWSHTEATGYDLVGEQLRWYDRWLKGVDNGVTRHPILEYRPFDQTSGAWRSTDRWPPVDQERTRFYLSTSDSETIDARHDGSLLRKLRPVAAEHSEYAVDPSATSGPSTCWADGHGARMRYPDMTDNDRSSVSYTSPALEAAVEVTGHPVLHVWVSATTPDVDVVAYLEEVDAAGVSHYVTEGVLRASHRDTTASGLADFGLPFHPGTATTASPLPAEPTELVFELLPTSCVFEAGHRLRLAVFGAARDDSSTRAGSPPPTLTLHCGGSHASYLVVPTIAQPPATRRD